ncbi:Acyl-CoA N-acyltransferase [Niveomyces insectorum RCEF 264]|uniref:Acyl-CoA N-acyltransferase n=1 Tax=Niveomyces insectorum RCEF 264 TaxID=1081102 RepID=A0A167WFB8_9HYPO|nr:Acyl-CoA N-acyltransferase [Niveomyces insectorum RCEF 264]
MASSGATQEKTPEWVTVLTTLPTRPLPPNTARTPLTTERLNIRPLAADDVAALHELRTQPEVMLNMKTGRIDESIDVTRVHLAPFLAPNDVITFQWAICLRASSDNKLIGIGGCRPQRGQFGWPDVGYMFNSAYWGQGYATEFVRGFLQLYAALPRTPAPVSLQVPRSILPDDWDNDAADPANPVVVEEKLTAIVPDHNAGSQAVLRKAGFEEFALIVEPDLRDLNQLIKLHLFQAFPGRIAKSSLAERA